MGDGSDSSVLSGGGRDIIHQGREGSKRIFALGKRKNREIRRRSNLHKRSWIGAPGRIAR